MNFLRDKHLKQLGAYLVVLTLIVFIVQYFIIDFKINQVEEAELKIEYTQIAQLNNQQISFQVQQFLNGDKSIAPSIAAKIDEQNFHLKTLSKGGRMGQRNEFIKPLTRLPRITYQGLTENWENYKTTLFVLISGPEKIQKSSEDSVQEKTADAVSLLVKSNSSMARMQYEGLSLTMNRWYERLIEDLNEEVQHKKAGLGRWKTGLLLVNIAVILGLYFVFVTLVLKPLSVIEENIKTHQRTEHFPPNELGNLAGAINETVENLRDATDFVVAIGKGDLTFDYKEVLDHHYEPGQNRLADSLIEMQGKLRSLNEEEQKRQWANEGLAKFVEILRSSNDDLNTLGDRIISALIHYTRSNQGALYVLNEEDNSNKYLELISLYAWEIKKHEQQKIKPGQGLLGQTLLERETTYLTILPEEYVRITSGLGGASPKSILIVPLKVDKDVYGLVELASFNEFQPHEISFVEKLGEMIASTLASVNAAHKNKILIEQFQHQTEQMRAQEEEMRQNMEELQATQEEVMRKEKSYIARITELEREVVKRSDPEELSTLKVRFKILEEDYRKKIGALENELERKSAKAAQWHHAEELNNALQVNLEAIRITQEELDKKKR